MPQDVCPPGRCMKQGTERLHVDVYYVEHCTVFGQTVKPKASTNFVQFVQLLGRDCLRILIDSDVTVLFSTGRYKI